MAGDGRTPAAVLEKAWLPSHGIAHVLIGGRSQHHGVEPGCELQWQALHGCYGNRGNRGGWIGRYRTGLNAAGYGGYGGYGWCARTGWR